MLPGGSWTDFGTPKHFSKFYKTGREKTLPEAPGDLLEGDEAPIRNFGQAPIRNFGLQSGTLGSNQELSISNFDPTNQEL